jgi:hypothetical protein
MVIGAGHDSSRLSGWGRLFLLWFRIMVRWLPGGVPDEGHLLRCLLNQRSSIDYADCKQVPAWCDSSWSASRVEGAAMPTRCAYDISALTISRSSSAPVPRRSTLTRAANTASWEFGPGVAVESRCAQGGHPRYPSKNCKSDLREPALLRHENGGPVRPSRRSVGKAPGQ